MAAHLPTDRPVGGSTVRHLVYFSLDCEASGPMPPLYNLLSIGVSAVRPDEGHHENRDKDANVHRGFSEAGEDRP